MDRAVRNSQGVVMTDMPKFRCQAHAILVTWPPKRRPVAAGLALLAAPLRGLARAYKRWRERERAIAELARLDDVTLADIGLHRSEIRSAVIDADTPGGPQSRRRSR
jgi:uncharacterized protein YjiS (DUF1127 family)